MIDERNDAWMELIYTLKEINETLQRIMIIMEEKE